MAEGGSSVEVKGDNIRHWGAGPPRITPVVFLHPPLQPPEGWADLRSAHSLGPPSPSSIPSLTPVSLSPSPLPLLHHPESRLHSLSIIPPVVCHRVQRSSSRRSSRSSRGRTGSAPPWRCVHTTTLCLSRPSPRTLAAAR